MDSLNIFKNKLIKLIYSLATIISIAFFTNLYAGGAINKDLVLGNWKLVSIYYSDSSRTRSFDKTLKNGILITKNEVSEIIHKGSHEKPYKMTHSYVIEGNCIILIQPSENVCWEVKTMTDKNLVLITPIGEYHLEK